MKRIAVWAFYAVGGAPRCLISRSIAYVAFTGPIFQPAIPSTFSENPTRRITRDGDLERSTFSIVILREAGDPYSAAHGSISTVSGILESPGSSRAMTSGREARCSLNP